MTIPVTATAALQRLRITGGDAPGGAGVLNRGTATLTRCTVTENGHPFGAGGGIANQGMGQLTLTDCAVTNNTAVNGAGIEQFSAQPVTLHNTLVQNNHAVQPFPGAGALGGGIFISAGSVAITDNSRITGNTAGTTAGGVFNAGTVTCSTGGRVGGNTVGGNPNNCVDAPGGTGCNTCPV